MTLASENSSEQKRILILGAGRSSTYLIDYLAKVAPEKNWKLIVGDMELAPAQRKTEMYPHVDSILFDVFDQKQREMQINQADVVISMLPAIYHVHVARACMRFSKHLFTASYISSEVRELNIEATRKNLLILMECGLDPGLDHMSAMRIIDRIHEKGGKISLLRSWCGGQISKQNNDNPWKYKFTWNPRNLVVSGQSMVKFLHHGQYKFIPSHQVFARVENVNIKGFGEMEGYGNRDSLNYREAYRVPEVSTLLRGTLRPKGFSEAWQILVRLGLTESVHRIEGSENLTYREWVELFLEEKSELSLAEQVAEYLNVDVNSEAMRKVIWLGLFSDEKIGIANATPAEILQHLLEKKWQLTSEEEDIIAVQHEIEYELNGEHKRLVSSLLVRGEDFIHTAMAKTVGYPLAVAVKLLLEGKITARGVQIPVVKEIYEPVLTELEHLGLVFQEEETTIANSVEA
ncbi:saccharopine dehydrogenase C-terminal domain-containing protein [Xanthocytophaga agilis]|uniref:Saccharopine dehydrogenase C-terminal domain-containing protein n=1 Tax=Xanthocytophaga agilis TaxID=3048010 RepID=A0AAE3RCS2_9BACT|nr:saccharopine dehydrogenase C-terminal domain-containing protein [Xanthocytophaga agilis]MDJ1505462.1 saccharopine dehydrogenase C-terminal domain-containing protein [Xanthocytophaga agilis]